MTREPILAGAGFLASTTTVVGTTSTVIVPSRPTRVSVVLLNIGNMTCYIGPTTATTSMGPLDPQCSLVLTAPSAIAGITTAGSCNIAAWDEFD